MKTIVLIFLIAFSISAHRLVAEDAAQSAGNATAAANSGAENALNEAKRLEEEAKKETDPKKKEELEKEAQKQKLQALFNKAVAGANEFRRSIATQNSDNPIGEALETGSRIATDAKNGGVTLGEARQNAWAGVQSEQFKASRDAVMAQIANQTGRVPITKMSDAQRASNSKAIQKDPGIMAAVVEGVHTYAKQYGAPGSQEYTNRAIGGAQYLKDYGIGQATWEYNVFQDALIYNPPAGVK